MFNLSYIGLPELKDIINFLFSALKFLEGELALYFRENSNSLF